jgi:hypothetical protein
MKGQGMGDLYKYLIEDYHKDLQRKGYLSDMDTLHFTCGFCDCPKDCFNYDFELQSKKVGNFPSITYDPKTKKTTLEE